MLRCCGRDNHRDSLGICRNKNRNKSLLRYVAVLVAVLRETRATHVSSRALRRRSTPPAPSRPGRSHRGSSPPLRCVTP